MPEVDTGSGIALLVMGILYGAGFLTGAWFLVRRISRKENQFHNQDPTTTRVNSEDSAE